MKKYIYQKAVRLLKKRKVLGRAVALSLTTSENWYLGEFWITLEGDTPEFKRVRWKEYGR
jgi:hypothetical protein